MESLGNEWIHFTDGVEELRPKGGKWFPQGSVWGPAPPPQQQMLGFS